MIEPNCYHTGCTKKATMLGEIRVPATGWPLHKHAPITMIVGHPMCDEHVEDVRVPEIFTPDIRKLFAIMTRGKAPPDFNRAFVVRKPVNNADVQMLLERQANASHP